MGNEKAICKKNRLAYGDNLMFGYCLMWKKGGAKN